MYKIPANTLFIGQNIVFVPECHSTNSTLMNLVHEFEEGAVLITSNQTAGRGQRGNSWESEAEKNLTFSLLLKPTFLKPADQFLLTIIISLAITDSLQNLLPENSFKIKWPNDILANSKKICGILIENSISNSSIQHSVIGMGLNINQQAFSVNHAVSLSMLSQQQHNLNLVLNLVLANIEKRYLQLKNGRAIELKKEYLNRLFGKDELRSFLYKENKIEALIKGVDGLGHLIVDQNGETLILNNKEIGYLL